MERWSFPCHTKGRPRAWLTPYRSFSEALAASGSGFNAEAYAQWSVEGCKRQQEALGRKAAAPGSINLANTRILMALAGISKNHIRVLDLGGGAGFHYFIAKAALGETVTWEWRVVETTALVDAAKSLTNEELKFFDDLYDATEDWDSPDLVFASGVIQCLPDALSTLRRLCSLGPEVLCITRTAVSPDAESHILMQEQVAPVVRGVATHGSAKVRYPVVLLPRRNYENVLDEYFETVLRLVEDPNVYRIAGRMSHMVGYICRGARLGKP